MTIALAAAGPPRLLYVVNDARSFITFRLPIARAAQAEGYEVHLATPPDAGKDRISGDGFILHDLALARGRGNIFSELGSILQLFRLFRAVRPSVVHLVTVKPVLYGGLAARVAGVPGVVAAVAGLGSLFVFDGVRARATRILLAILFRAALSYRRLRAVFQNANDMATVQRIARLPPERAVLIPGGSGVSLADYPVVPEPDGIPIVVFVARLLWQKGVREFVEAARQLRTEGTEARFWLVGDIDPANPSSLSSSDLAEIEAEGLVDVLGYRKDVPVLLQQANMVVLPSFYGEGLPKALIEAAASARAVVTTDVPGCRDALIAGETGLLVRPRDSVALANAIGTLLADPVRRRAMGLKGREFAEKTFDIRQVVAAHLKIYADLLG
jgi:glycosyltransferase involved in cell wall biosynthesis